MRPLQTLFKMADSRTNIGRFRWLSLSAVALVFFIASLLWQGHLQAVSRNRTNAQLDLVTISDSLESLSADSAVAISKDAVTNLDARVLYSLLSSTNGGAFLLEHRNDWDQRHELVDPWGRPFHMQLIYPATDTNSSESTTTAMVKIWSVGPNGRDEQGTGDDITCQTVAIRLRK